MPEHLAAAADLAFLIAPLCSGSRPCGTGPANRAQLGVYLGLVQFERTGSYGIVWWLSVLFGVISTVINLPIVEKPVARSAAAAA